MADFYKAVESIDEGKTVIFNDADFKAFARSYLPKMPEEFLDIIDDSCFVAFRGWIDDDDNIHSTLVRIIPRGKEDVYELF